MTNFWTIVGAILVAKSIWYAVLASTLVFKKVRLAVVKWSLKFNEEILEMELKD